MADDPSDDDEARRFILTRRAKFVAAALAGVGTAAGVATYRAMQPCLEPPPLPTDQMPIPSVCLSPPPMTATATPPEPPRPANPGDAGPPPERPLPGSIEKPHPAPCLKIKAPEPPPPPPRPEPHICLSPVIRSPKDG